MATPKNVEEELRALDLDPLNKYYTYTEKGDYANYIKVMNNYGQTFYVHLDAPGMICEGGVCRLIGSNLPLGADYFQRVTKSIPPSIAGLALECSGSVCTIVRTPEGWESQTFGQAFPVEIPTVQYPIIRLSELRVNPQLTLRNAIAVSRQYWNELYNKSMLRLDANLATFERYTSMVKEFYRLAKNVAERFGRSVTRIDRLIKTYGAKTMLTPEENRIYGLLFYNLKLRSEMLSTYLKMINSFSSMLQVNASIEMVDSYIRAFDQFKDIDNLIDAMEN